MKKIVFSFFLLVSILFSANGQRSESEIALREYFIDAEFFLAQEFYLDALNDYLQVYRRGYKDNANINYRIGICYLNIPGQKEKAIKYFEIAEKSISISYKQSSLNEKAAPIDVYLYLGNAFRVNNMLDKAVDSYMQYKKLLPEDEEDLHKYVDQQIEACNIANEFMDNPVKLKSTNLGKVINTSNDDYKAIISGDGSTLVYMHRLPFYDAVYFSKKEDNIWTKPKNITPHIMSDGDQFVTSLSFDGKTLLLTKEDEFNSDIMISRFEENRWTVSQALGSDINTKYWESHASISKDGKSLYFASNRRSGHGASDLYFSEMLEDGTYGSVQNISELNTELNEDTPFITEDGSMLFFSSQSFTSMGGYDIFVSRREGSSWSLPKNLGFPINTTDDNLFYYPMENGQSALLSRIEDNGYGGLDIYEINYKELPLALQKEEPAKEIEEMKEPEPESAVALKELDKVVEDPIEEKVSESVKDEITEIEELSATVEPEEVKEVDEKEQIEKPAERKVYTISLQPVLFGFDKTLLTTEGKAELDKVVLLAKQNPGIQVILIGFTDPLGPESYNLVLSGKRAQTTLDYLVAQGIDKSKLKAVGKGETNFIAINTKSDGKDSKEGRMYNRRVEFEINGIDTKEVIIKRIDPVPPELKIK